MGYYAKVTVNENFLMHVNNNRDKLGRFATGDGDGDGYINDNYNKAHRHKYTVDKNLDNPIYSNEIVSTGLDFVKQKENERMSYLTYDVQNKYDVGEHDKSYVMNAGSSFVGEHLVDPANGITYDFSKEDPNKSTGNKNNSLSVSNPNKSTGNKNNSLSVSNPNEAKEKSDSDKPKELSVRNKAETSNKRIAYFNGAVKNYSNASNSVSNMSNTAKSLVELLYGDSAYGRKYEIDFSKMSDNELRDAVNRYALEQRYNDTFNPSVKNQDLAKIEDFISAAGTIAATSLTVIGLVNAINGAKKK